MGTATNVIVGAAAMWIGPAATAAPLEGTSGATFATPDSPWVSVGFTEKGLTFNVDRKTSKIMVEEQSTPVLILTDTQDISIELTFAEATIANMTYAYGGGTVTTTAAASMVPGSTTLALSDTLTALACYFTGPNPAGFARSVYIPSVVSTGKVKTSFERAKAAQTYPATFEAICPASSIIITDLTAVAT